VNLARLMQLLDISMFARFFCEKMSLLLNTLWFRFTAGTSKIFLPLIHAPLTSILSVAASIWWALSKSIKLNTTGRSG